MITGKPIVINGGKGLGKLLAGLMPTEPEPLHPCLPYSKKQSRRWGVAIMMCILGPLFLCLFGLPIAAIAIQLKVPTFAIAGFTFLLVSFGVYKLGHNNIYDLLSLTETEWILTVENVEWFCRRPFSADEVHRIPLSEYLGLRFEVHEVTRNHPNRYTHEFYYVTLVHPDQQKTLNLYCGQTSQHIPYVLQGWAELLPLPVLEPNELAKQRLAILASAERNRGNLVFQS